MLLYRVVLWVLSVSVKGSLVVLLAGVLMVLTVLESFTGTCVVEVDVKSENKKKEHLERTETDLQSVYHQDTERCENKITLTSNV